MQFLIDNIATIIAAIVVAAIIVFVVIKIFRDRKKGKSSCGCDCASCGNSSSCH